MHGALWYFAGDPDTMVRAYEGVLAEVPADVMRLHACVRTETGIVVFDTCPTREDFESWATNEGFREIRARHGLPDPVALENGGVTAAFVDGRRVV
jgi:hypothetical protein